jgi:hypothetical protein
LKATSFSPHNVSAHRHPDELDTIDPVNDPDASLKMLRRGRSIILALLLLISH